MKVKQLQIYWKSLTNLNLTICLNQTNDTHFCFSGFKSTKELSCGRNLATFAKLFPSSRRHSTNLMIKTKHFSLKRNQNQSKSNCLSISKAARVCSRMNLLKVIKLTLPSSVLESSSQTQRSRGGTRRESYKQVSKLATCHQHLNIRDIAKRVKKTIQSKYMQLDLVFYQ